MIDSGIGILWRWHSAVGYGRRFEHQLSIICTVECNGAVRSTGASKIRQQEIHVEHPVSVQLLRTVFGNVNVDDNTGVGRIPRSE